MKILLVLLGLFASSLTFAALSDGMDKTLDLTHVNDHDYLEFKNFRTRPRAPIAGGIRINGERVRSMEEIFAVFGEEVKAMIPEGKTIIESKDSEGRIVWTYPIGMRVIHQLNFKNDKKTLFELRMIQKVEEKRWAFGTYVKEGNKLVLQSYRGHRDEEYNLRTHDGKPLHISLHHIPLHVCQNCHARTTSAPHQYSDIKDVGPCEFTAENPHVKNEWVQNFISAFGRNPISKKK